MAFIQLDCFSETLELSVNLNVILPQPASDKQIGMASAAADDATQRGHPTLYLFHGLSDDHTIWMRRTSVERYAAQRGLAVIMPAVNRSMYADTAFGHNYWAFVSDELPRLMRSFFPLSAAREDNFVAGLSMGGYGAFKLALARPGCFAAAASLSGVLDAARFFSTDGVPDRNDLMGAVFGDPDAFRDTHNDLMYMARRLAAAQAEMPRLYQCCGTKDFLYDQNLTFRDHARGLGLDLVYHEHEGADHTWDYWDARIADVIDWLPIRSVIPESC